MITLRDIIHLPELEPWFEQIARRPSGLVVIAGLDGEGLGGVLGILYRQMLAVPRAGRQPRRVLVIGAQARFVRPERGRQAPFTFVCTVGPKAPTAAEALQQPAAYRADLIILDELNADNLIPALALAARGIAILAPLDTLLAGGQVLGFLMQLGAPEALLAHVAWIIGVQRVRALCRHCAEAWAPSPEECQALGLEPQEATRGRFSRNRGCPECASEEAARFITAFDIFRQDAQNGPPASQLERVSDLPLRAYVLGLARQGHVPLAEVRSLGLNMLQRAQNILLQRQRELARTEVELRAKAATLEASQHLLLNYTEALISLQDVTQTLAASTDSDLARRILHHVRQIMGADLVALYLIEPDGSGRIAAISGWDPHLEGKPIPAAEIAPWLERATGDHDALIAGQVPPGISLLRGRQDIRAGLLLVLAARGVPVGLLFAHSTLKRQFTTGEKNILRMFADQAAVAIQRQRLIAELQAKIVALEQAQAEIVKKERLESELELARKIQESFIPSRFPSFPGLSLAARSVPARAVGGDFYDAFALPGKRVGLVIGDVSDKGMPAALFMALTRSLVRAEAQREASPAQVLANVNRLLLEMSNSAMFVTVFYGVLGLERGELIYARAGHERPLHLSAANRACRPLPGGGIALAVLPSPALQNCTVTLQPGDELILFTDGVTDQPLPDGEAYGYERLTRSVEANMGLDVSAQCAALLAELSALRAEIEPFDDTALLFLRYEQPLMQGGEN